MDQRNWSHPITNATSEQEMPRAHSEEVQQYERAAGSH